MEFSRQEYWSGLLCPPPWDCPKNCPIFTPKMFASDCWPVRFRDQSRWSDDVQIKFILFRKLFSWQSHSLAHFPGRTFSDGGWRGRLVSSWLCSTAGCWFTHHLVVEGSCSHESSLLWMGVRGPCFTCLLTPGEQERIHFVFPKERGAF